MYGGWREPAPRRRWTARPGLPPSRSRPRGAPSSPRSRGPLGADAARDRPHLPSAFARRGHPAQARPGPTPEVIRRRGGQGPGSGVPFRVGECGREGRSFGGLGGRHREEGGGRDRAQRRRAGEPPLLSCVERGGRRPGRPAVCACARATRPRSLRAGSQLRPPRLRAPKFKEFRRLL